MALRTDIRNIAIIAHVDHGKTTLVDAMLSQTGAFRDNEEVSERIMDSGELEKEKGITILAKNTSVIWNNITFNIVDTPGHADFGGEVERALTMVDGVLLLVDAAEGPLPQTRFVLRKALAKKLPVILAINKVDRPDARISEVVDEAYELFIDLGADDDQIDFPIVYCSAKNGWASLDGEIQGENLEPLFKLLETTISAPEYDESMPLQALVTNLDSSPYLGRLALCRVVNGELKKSQSIGLSRLNGSIKSIKISEMYLTQNLDRVPAEIARPGDLVAIAGVEDIAIGETLVDLENPMPLPIIKVDEPALSMTIGTNNSPLAGKDGDKLTARLVKNRLDQELVGNMSLRILPTQRPDAWEVQARGELQLAVLVEQMRREGFELTVGKPQVLIKEIDGKKHEPVERVTIDIPEEYMGAVTQLLAERKGRLENMFNPGAGWVRLDYLVPARGLIGVRTIFMTETKGTGIINHSFEKFEPWFGELKTRQTGSLISDRAGVSTTYSMLNLQERATMLCDPGSEVYNGMIVGENSREDDMEVNITKEKQLTNHRAASADQTVKLTPIKHLSLEQSLEFIKSDECVEVTPINVRLRKVELDPKERAKIAKQHKQAANI